MKASHSWLLSLVPGLTAAPRELADRLTFAGLEVEGLSVFGEGLESVVVGRVVAIAPHPSRAGLRLVTVDRGSATQQVVCGAPNVPPPGGLVALAPLGARLPAVNMTIEPRPIGGVVSEGMLCSESELGIGAGSGGILVLDAGTPGEPLTAALPSARDTILEINVTPNRPDALGHRGLARDIAAIYGLPFRPESPQPLAEGPLGLPIFVDDPSLCPYLGAALVENVTVGPSPLWLQHRLTSLGVRAISNLVDLTNLVLLDRGQPMHAFDRQKIRGELRVRRARPGEPLVTLDGKSRALVADDLVVADAERALSLAGVMGGADSEIGPETREVLLECAYFEPRAIRRASRRHGLHTESSHRFERGIDSEGSAEALAAAVGWLAALSPGARLRGHGRVAAPPAPKSTIRLRSARLDALLGVAVPFDEAVGILERLGCPPASRAEGEVRVTAPSWRPDLTREADLIEEVARVRGLHHIPPRLPPIAPQPPRTTGLTESAARRAAASLGLSEAVTYAFVSPRELEALSAPAATVRLTNPLTEERSVLRTSLLPGLLEAVARARRHGERGARLFTVGRTYLAPEAGPLPRERRGLAAVLAGPRPGYLERPADHDVYDAKGIAEELIARVSGQQPAARAATDAERPAHLHPRGAGLLEVGGQRIGQFGPLHPEVVDRLDLGGPAVVVEIDLDALEALGQRVPQASPVPRLPPVSRDISLLVPEGVLAGQVEQMIREAAGDLGGLVELFDVFRGPGLAEGHRSLAYHVLYRDPRDAEGREGARTLTDAEVDERHRAVQTAVQARLGATLRT